MCPLLRAARLLLRSVWGRSPSALQLTPRVCWFQYLYLGFPVSLLKFSIFYLLLKLTFL